MACRDCEDLYSFPVGPQGPVGEDGAAGVNGNYITVANEAAGANCASGGKRITLYSGADDSVLSTHYVCDGAAGAAGADGTSVNKYIEEITISSIGTSLIDDASHLYYAVLDFTVGFCDTLADGCGGATPSDIDFVFNIWYRAGTSNQWVNVTNGYTQDKYVLQAKYAEGTLKVQVTKAGIYRVVAIG